MAIEYTRASSKDELQQILALQKQNMAKGLSEEEVLKEGFVTVGHTYDILARMNSACPHIIAKEGNLVIGYALAMLAEFKNEIPLLRPMFETATGLLGAKNYLAMGQVCVSKAYRRQGIFRGMYLFYKEALENEFDCLITEVATGNKRSLQAHKSVGFETIKTHLTDGVSWELLNWNWE